MSFLSSMFGGGSKGSNNPPPAPPFQNDPLVGQTDTGLFNFGSDVLKGILPSSYQDLIESNSPQFQTMLKNSNAQIQGSGLETEAMNGNARSGAAGAGITQAIASNTANLSYQDLLNTQLNQKSLIGAGLDSLSASGNLALGNQGQENSYASGNYQAGLGYSANMAATSQRAASAAGTSLFSGLGQLGGGIGSILGSLGSLGAGTATGTTFGAAAGSGTFSIDALLASGAPLALAV